jgi:ABC-type enterochelin transport system substrate-binding protein
LAKKRRINKIREGHLKEPDFGSNLTTTQTEMADCTARQSKKYAGLTNVAYTNPLLIVMLGLAEKQ